MQFSAEKYEKQSSYVIQSTEYNNLLHVHKVRAQSEKLLKGVNIHGLTLCIDSIGVSRENTFINYFNIIIIAEIQQHITKHRML